MDKTFIELYASDNWKGFQWEKNSSYYYLFPSNDNTKGVVYRMLVFDNKDDFEKRLTGERIDAKQIVGIKEMHGDRGIWYSGILFDRDNKKAWYVNLYENTTPSPEKKHDKMIVLKQAEYREQPGVIDRAKYETGD